jgi:UDP-N-acetylmuramoyl-tripeptide--D-alanyl-D-alanine ligase
MNKLFKPLIISILTLEARIVLRRFRPFLIGVTGSVGKTSTKDAIASVLQHNEGIHMVRKSDKSMNSDIGIPLTILGLDNAWTNPFIWAYNLIKGAILPLTVNYPKILVLEVGADQPDDIYKLLPWLKLDMVVVTRLPDVPVHVENFTKPEDVQDEEWSLTYALRDGGIAVINGDDPNIMSRRVELKQNVLTFGFGALAAMRGVDPHIDYVENGEAIIPKGMGFSIEWKGTKMPAQIKGVLGDQLLYSLLAGVAVGSALGYELKDAIDGAEETVMPPGRMRVLLGKNNSVLLDDSYNASPVAVEAALMSLRKIKGEGRRIALLGDMLELGEFSEQEHRRIGRIASKETDILVTVGIRALWIGDEAIKNGMDNTQVYTFPTSDEAGEWMHHHLQQNDVVLLKGSQGSGENKIRMERATKQLLLHPEEAADLLVRQESEWEWR